MSRNLTYHLLNGGRKQWMRSCSTARSIRPNDPSTPIGILADISILGAMIGTVGGTLSMAEVWRRDDSYDGAEKAAMFIPFLTFGAAFGCVAGGSFLVWAPVYGLTKVADKIDPRT